MKMNIALHRILIIFAIQLLFSVAKYSPKGISPIWVSASSLTLAAAVTREAVGGGYLLCVTVTSLLVTSGTL